MNIEDLTVEVRPRRPHEAMDLGIRMTQRWFGAIYGPWLVILLPFWAFLNLCSHQLPWLLLFLFWWLKPIWDRIPIFVLSRAMFGDPPTTAETLKALPGQIRLPWLGPLFWFRLSPNRLIDMPVYMLENMRGKKRQSRVSLLTRTLVEYTMLVTMAYFVFEWILAYGFYQLVMLLVPEAYAGTLGWGAGEEGLPLVMVNFYILASLILEPFYAATCFSLYINRRTLLEGWDLELAFKRIAVRLQEGTKISMLLCCALAAWFAAPPAIAQEEAVKSAKEDIRTVMTAPEFGEEKTVTRWRLRLDPEETPEASESEDLDLSALGMLGVFGKFLFYGLLAIAIILLVAFVIYLINRRKPRGLEALSAEKPAEVVPDLQKGEGFAIDPTTLPTDIVQAARQRWQSGNGREALSLLFRGAIHRLVESGRIEIADFATEGECLRLVRRQIEGEPAQFFADLTLAWQAAAYAHRMPEGERFESLCQSWMKHLGVVT